MDNLLRAKLKKGGTLTTEMNGKVYQFDDQHVFEGEIVKGNYGDIFFVKGNPIGGCGFRLAMFDLITENVKELQS